MSAPKLGPRERREPPPVVTIGALYWLIVQLLVRPLFATVFRTRVVGREHLPRTGGALIAANHQSYLDIPLIARAVWPAHVSFAARDSLADQRWLAWVMARCGTVLVRRGQGDLSAMRRIARHLELGDRVAIFPEGTRTMDGRLGAFKKGAVVAARLAGVPIVPCAIRGSYDAWPRTARIPRPHRLELRFGPPVDSAGADALGEVRARIAAMLGETPPSPPVHPAPDGARHPAPDGARDSDVPQAP